MLIQKNIPLKNYTTFRTGGPADYFCEVETREDLVECFKWIKRDKLDFFCLGNGSNLLVNDLGFRGVVIKIDNNSTTWSTNRSLSGAGIILAALVNDARNHNLGGLEWAFGIPATLGGAVRNNAGAFGYAMADRVYLVEVFNIQTERFQKVERKNCEFSYRKSTFQKEPSWLIWQVELAWAQRDKNEINKNIQNYLDRRREKQPLDYPSAGSFFRNPSTDNLEKNTKNELADRFVREELTKLTNEKNLIAAEREIRKRINQSDTLPAGFLIEETGLKGHQIGGARVSNKHANFIVNTGNAKTEDAVILASIVKQKVRAKFGIQLHEEVEYVGF